MEELPEDTKPSEADLQRARRDHAQMLDVLDNLSSLTITSNPRFREWVWKAVTYCLDAMDRIEKGESRYVLPLEANIRTLQAFYHATPQNWRRIAKQHSKAVFDTRSQEVQSLEKLFPNPTTWQRYRDLVVTTAVTALVSTVVTWVVLRYLLH